MVGEDEDEIDNTGGRDGPGPLCYGMARQLRSVEGHETTDNTYGSREDICWCRYRTLGLLLKKARLQYVLDSRSVLQVAVRALESGHGMVCPESSLHLGKN